MPASALIVGADCHMWSNSMNPEAVRWFCDVAEKEMGGPAWSLGASSREPLAFEGMDMGDGPPIRRLRQIKGLSLNELAASIRMDPAHLDLIERQSPFATPTLGELEAIAAVLSCTVEDIRI
jgi:DNA-binding Xre family transcriptional regulator